MTLEEKRAGAISGRAWKTWDGPVQEPRAKPGQEELAADKERLLGDIRDLKATNAKLGAALRNLRADNEKLRAMCVAVLETAFGADWKEQLKGVMNDGEHDDSEGNDRAPQGE